MGWPKYVLIELTSRNIVSSKTERDKDKEEGEGRLVTKENFFDVLASACNVKKKKKS